MKSEKGIFCRDASLKNLNHNNMTKYKPKTREFQFNSPNPPKIFETINCFKCHNERQFDGYVFKLVPLCADCRTESELKTLANRIERRAKR